ncbi:MAG: hypothetical protein Q7V58_09570 [Actinomycetota bacterium]|nr:hypothetical protein [Actinomycetota bacterium]
MSDLVPSDRIEGIVGVQRHPAAHFGRAVSSEERFYILHSQQCLDTFADLRECPFSIALDGGELGEWRLDSPRRLDFDAFGLIDGGGTP